MDIWGPYKSKLGYKADDGKIDTYGVDHSKFSLRDELAYQMARSEREEQIIKGYNNQGITKDYPQYGTNFWGGNADNNYGFGSSNISENIEKLTDTLKNVSYPIDPKTGFIVATNQQNSGLKQQNNIFDTGSTSTTQQKNNLNDKSDLNITPTSTFDKNNYGIFSKPDILTKKGIQYAQNEYTNSASDAISTSSNEDKKTAIFNRVLNKSLREEGGYEDRTNRIDTPTNMGIQQSTLDRFKIAHPNMAAYYPNDI